MNDYAELKARLRNGVCQDQNDDVEIWETEQLMKQASVAIDAMERERDVWREKQAHGVKCEREQRARAEAAEARLIEARLAFENVDVQVQDTGEFTERAWEQLRAALQEDKSHE